MSSGACAPPPSRRGGGRAPSWPPPSRPLNSPGAHGYCHRLASTGFSHGTEMQAVGGENGRRYSQGIAAAASEASPKWPPSSRPPPPPPTPPPLPPTQLAIAAAGAARPLARDCNPGWSREARVLASGAAGGARQAGRCSPSGGYAFSSQKSASFPQKLPGQESCRATANPDHLLLF